MAVSVFAATITTDSLVSSEIDLGGRNHEVSLVVPTYAAGIITATANIYVQASEATSGTFRRVAFVDMSAASGNKDWEVPSAGDNRIYHGVPLDGLRYVKVESSNTATAALTCKFIVKQYG